VTITENIYGPHTLADSHSDWEKTFEHKDHFWVIDTYFEIWMVGHHVINSQYLHNYLKNVDMCIHRPSQSHVLLFSLCHRPITARASPIQMLQSNYVLQRPPGGVDTKAQSDWLVTDFTVCHAYSETIGEVFVGLRLPTRLHLFCTRTF
jgi:hypothetical protein